MFSPFSRNDAGFTKMIVFARSSVRTEILNCEMQISLFHRDKNDALRIGWLYRIIHSEHGPEQKVKYIIISIM